MILENSRKILSYDEMNNLVKNDESLDYIDEIIDDIEIRTFVYNILNPLSFTKIGSRNCRGMTFEKESKKLIALPFFKFFNYNENELYSKENINLWTPINIYDKIDGSMIYFFSIKDKLYCRTQKRYNNIQSIRALEFINNRPDYKKLIWNLIRKNYTPIFELISPKVDPHVVQYNFEELVFLGMRNMITGELIMPTLELYMELCPASKVTTILPRNRFKSIDQLITLCKKLETTRTNVIEGYTVLFNNNELVKFKTSQYLKIFKSVDECTKSDISVVQMIFDNKIDDLLIEIGNNEAVRLFINSIILSVSDIWNNRLKESKIFYDNNKDLSIKEFVLKAKKELDKKIIPIAIQNYKSMKDPNQISPSENKNIIKSFIASRDWRSSKYFDEYRDRFI